MGYNYDCKSDSTAVYKPAKKRPMSDTLIKTNKKSIVKPGHIFNPPLDEKTKQYINKSKEKAAKRAAAIEEGKKNRQAANEFLGFELFKN